MGRDCSFSFFSSFSLGCTGSQAIRVVAVRGVARGPPGNPSSLLGGAVLPFLASLSICHYPALNMDAFIASAQHRSIKRARALCPECHGEPECSKVIRDHRKGGTWASGPMKLSGNFWALPCVHICRSALKLHSKLCKLTQWEDHHPGPRVTPPPNPTPLAGAHTPGEI